jgi:hypothetical protein
VAWFISAVSMPIPAAQKAAHIAAVRAEGFPAYDIKPARPARSVYHTLVYVEPFNERNLRAFGFDMYSNPVRRLAMDRAIEQGLPSISGSVRLAQENGQNVQDWGRGIPDAFRPRIFQQFAQADSSDSRQQQHGGTGLGLSIAKAIIEQQGGSIDFDSSPGHGSRFFFRLPEVVAAAAEPAPTAAAQS